MRDGEVATTETSAVNYSAVRIVALSAGVYSATSKLCSLRFPPPGQVPAAYELDRHLPLAFSASGPGTEKFFRLYGFLHAMRLNTGEPVWTQLSPQE